MQNQGSLKLLFVINPISGGKEKHDWEAAIREFFKELPHSPEFFMLTGKNDKVSVMHHISTVSPDPGIAVGGDGTVKLIAGFLNMNFIAGQSELTCRPQLTEHNNAGQSLSEQLTHL